MENTNTESVTEIIRVADQYISLLKQASYYSNQDVRDQARSQAMNFASDWAKVKKKYNTDSSST